MNNLFIRIGAIILHAIIHFLVVNRLINFDISSKWNGEVPGTLAGHNNGFLIQPGGTQ